MTVVDALRIQPMTRNTWTVPQLSHLHEYVVVVVIVVVSDDDSMVFDWVVSYLRGSTRTRIRAP